MKLAIFVLNQIDLLDALLSQLMKEGIRGGTILDSVGMARYVSTHSSGEDLAELIRSLFPNTQHHNKTIIFCVDDHELAILKDVIERVTGGLGKPSTGILMVMPLLEVVGITQKRKEETNHD